MAFKWGRAFVAGHRAPTAPSFHSRIRAGGPRASVRHYSQRHEGGTREGTGVATTAIHAGETLDGTRASSPALHLSTTFAVAETLSFSGNAVREDDPYCYTRWANPTVRMLEHKVRFRFSSTWVYLCFGCVRRHHC